MTANGESRQRMHREYQLSAANHVVFADRWIDRWIHFMRLEHDVRVYGLQQFGWIIINDTPGAVQAAATVESHTESNKMIDDGRLE